MVTVDRSTRAEFGQGATNHKRCVNGDSCTGPGCRVTSGKTRDDKRPTASRERVKEWKVQFLTDAEREAQRGAQRGILGEPDTDGFYREWSI